MKQQGGNMNNKKIIMERLAKKFMKIRDPDLKGFALIEMIAYAAGKEAGKEAGKAEEQSEKK